MRLIDADEFLHTTRMATMLASICTSNVAKKEILKATYELIKERIGDAPTIEAEPLKQGIWFDKGTGICCPFCEEQYSDELFLTGKINFCPNCGAKLQV